jgi:hypothetical protein
VRKVGPFLLTESTQRDRLQSAKEIQSTLSFNCQKMSEYNKRYFSFFLVKGKRLTTLYITKALLFKVRVNQCSKTEQS